ncbi:MAG: ABC transporter ATP-binding protein [Chloroflexota bacterium]|nr:ABC transporter ATP-binding protein [Chloroflexota bacterium]
MSEQRSGEPILRMVGITKQFPGVLANDHVDLELYQGEVLALLGENGAGKSTLMNVLNGLYRPDEGAIIVKGQPVDMQSPRDAYNLGIGMVHQNFMLVETMTVAENVVLGLQNLPFQPEIRGVKRRLEALGERYGLRVDPDAYIWQLSVGEQQRVEILKLLYRDVDVLILDEPTAVLTPQEVDDLVDVLRQVVREGKAAIFITHKLREVMMFADRVTVLRDGRNVATRSTSETSSDELARLMVGREVLFRVDKTACEPGTPVLEVQGLRALNDKGLPALRGVSLTVRAGEIVGIAGVAGNGQRELAEVITGLREATAGEVIVNGRRITNCPPLRAIEAGVGHIPEDRVEMGLVGGMSVAENLALKAYRTSDLSLGPVLSPDSMKAFAQNLIEGFDIVTPGTETQVKFLSGGNLQKTILARELTACEGLLVAVHPTRGLDVGATETVRRQLLEERDRGTAVLLISEDLDELLEVSDRIAVMYEGQIVGTMPVDEADIESIGLMMAGEQLGKEGDGR